MMKQFIAAMLAIAVFTGASSCKKRVLRGEGPIISETRNLAEFSKVVTNGSEYVTIIKDDVYKVVISGYSSLIPQYETIVRGDKLILEYEDRYWNVKNSNIKVEVHTPYVDDVVLNGSGSVYVASGYDQANFYAEISGSGDVTLGHSYYERLDMEINGSGNIDAENAEAASAYARISGSGNIYTWVTDYLSVDISGSGDVYYKGNPRTKEISISGSGRVRRLD